MLPLLKNLIFTLVLLISISVLSASPWLGITIMEPKENVEFGVEVFSVDKDSPAEKSGLKSGDLLQKLDGEKVYTTDQLKKMIKSKEIGNKLKLEVVRAKKEITIKCTLEEKKVPMKTFLGVVVHGITEERQKKIDKNYGLYISRIVEGSSAEEAGLKKEDVLLSINKDKLYTPDQLSKVLGTYKPDTEVSIKYIRDGKEHSVSMKLGSKPIVTEEFGGNFLNYDFSVMPDKVTVLKFSDSFDRLGLKVEEIDGDIVVAAVEEKSQADRANLKKGDKIVQINKKKVKSIEMIDGILNEKKENEVIEVTVISGKKKKTVEMKLGAKKSGNSFDLTVDENGVRFIIDGKETELFNEGTIPKIKEFFKDLDVDEWLEEFKESIPEEEEIDLFFKKQINKEQV